MSSIVPHTSLSVAFEAKKKGINFLDAPVSGGTNGAEKGTLTIMVGGDKALVDQHMEIFRALGKPSIISGMLGEFRGHHT